MPPSKWDDEEESPSPPPVAPRRRFDDEEEEEEVLDSWDAAEDSEAEREKQAKAAAEAKAKAAAEAAAKKSKAQRIEELRERRQQAKAATEGKEDEDSAEDEAERLRRLRRTEKESDLKHAEDLFGTIDVDRMAKRTATAKPVVVTDSANPTNAVDLSAMPLFKPTSKDQFTQLTKTLMPLLTANSKKPHFALWAQDFTKQLVKELPSAEVKKIASAMTTIGNEKMKEERAADKGSKKTKAAKTKVTLNMSRDNKVDDAVYDGDDGLDDGDFM